MRDAQQPVGLLVVAQTLRAGEHGGVVGEHGATDALDAGEAGEHAIGRRLADQLLDRAAPGLRRVGEGAVLDEAACVAQVGDVLARRAQAARVAARHRLGARGVAQQGFALAQFVQFGAQCGWRGRGFARHLGLPGQVRRAQAQQRIALGQQLARLGHQREHAAVVRGAQLVLHLHGLDHGEQVAGTHGLAGGHGQLDHRGGHRGADLLHRHATTVAPPLALQSSRPGQTRTSCSSSPRSPPPPHA